MSDRPRIIYRPRSGATPEKEADALADVYSYILECRERKAAEPSDGQDDARESLSDCADERSIPPP